MTEKQLEELLADMSLEEKVYQMMQLDVMLYQDGEESFQAGPAAAWKLPNIPVL